MVPPYCSPSPSPPITPLPYPLVHASLLKVSAGKHHDALATTCIKFLTLVVGKQIHRELFGSEETLREIVKNIAIPNVKMRPADEETFEVR